MDENELVMLHDKTAVTTKFECGREFRKRSLRCHGCNQKSHSGKFGCEKYVLRGNVYEQPWP